MEEIWRKTLASIESRVEEEIFEAWFKPLRPIGLDGTSLVLAVPSADFLACFRQDYSFFVSNELNFISKRKVNAIKLIVDQPVDNYLDELKDKYPAFSENFLPPSSKDFSGNNLPNITENQVLSKDLSFKTQSNSDKSSLYTLSSLSNSIKPIISTPEPSDQQLTLDFDDFSQDSQESLFPESVKKETIHIEKKILDKKDSKKRGNSPSVIEVSSNKDENRLLENMMADSSIFTNVSLNEKYSFNKFISGASNQFASAASKRITEAPGEVYNPLFIYGNSGLGKTHLLHAIGLELKQKHNFKNIIFKAADHFVSDVISCIRHQKMERFNIIYNNCDALILDDIQFLRGNTTQEEFFHIFNILHQNKKPIIITSDKLPEYIPKIEERLKNRFKWGLIVDIQPPDFDHRLAILLSKCEQFKVNIPFEVVEYVASNIKSNVRDLEGAINRLSAYSSFSGEAVTIESAINVLRNLVDKDQTKLTIDLIQRYVAKYFDLKISDLKSSSKTKIVSMPRQIAMYLAREMLENITFPEIGEKFGGKDHSSVIYSYNKVKKTIKKDADMQHDVNTIIRQLKEL